MANVLERGNIYFAYRPRVEEDTAGALEDIQRFFMILSPHDSWQYRLLVVGRKRLPDIEERHRERNWMFVQKVGHRPEDVEDELDVDRYETKTRGTRRVASARPVGEGVYALTRHDDHTHLAYALELPKKPGQVQEALAIPPKASYIVAVKNPEQASPPGVGLGEAQRAEMPKRLMERFKNRRFVPVDPPDFLDQQGAELVLIGADTDPTDELGISLDPEQETAQTAEIFDDLHMEREEHPLRPLFEGKWE